jgi:hypothetical protein
MATYKNTETNEVIDSYEYNQLSSYEKKSYREVDDSGNFLPDGIIDDLMMDGDLFD